MTYQTRIRHATVMIFTALATLFVGLVVLFLVNNRPPNITVPSPKMPKDNGWDYFVKAGEIIGQVRHWGPYSQTRPLSSWTLKEYE